MKIIDLTADKEIPAQQGGRVIDLTKALDGTHAAQPAGSPPGQPPPSSKSLTRDESRNAERRRQEEIDAEIDLAFGADPPPESPPASQKAPENPAEPPNPCTAASEPSAEDEVIDLEDPVLPEMPEALALDQAAEGIIELTDIVPPDAPRDEACAPVASAAEADAPIELVDVVTPDRPAPAAAGDEIIELVDVVDEIIELEDVVQLGSPPEEEIIELTDIVKPGDLAAKAAAPAGAAPQAQMAEIKGRATHSDAPADEIDLVELDRLIPVDDEPDDEQVIQLADHRKGDRPETGFAMNLDEAPTATANADKANPLEVIGMELNRVDPEARGLSPEAIEAAIEKILYTKYADRIEHLIAIAVEKAVTREIEQIRREFVDDAGLGGEDDER